MREARAAKENTADDCSTLTRVLHERRAAKEEAETALGATVAMTNQARCCSPRISAAPRACAWRRPCLIASNPPSSSPALQVRGDWQAKLRDQRKVGRDIQRRRESEARAAEAAAAAAAERAEAEAERSTRSEREREAREARLSAVVPQLEALEVTWARLHALTASSSAEGVIAFWQGEA